MDFLQNHIEALIFCSSSPVKVGDLQTCLSEMFATEIPKDHILKAIKQLEEKYASDDFSFQLFKSAGGYQFLTKPSYQSSIGILLKHNSKKRLSTSALETLAIIAYKQPVAKPEVDGIRGVNCDFAIQRLLDKELIEIRGKAHTVGRPLLYGTTQKFMEYFGINDITDLPQPKDLSTEDNIAGESTDLKDRDAQT